MNFCVRVVVLLCLLAAWLPAQSWESLRALQTGSVVRVSDDGGHSKKGRWKSTTPDALVLETGKGEVSFRQAQVKRVEVQRTGRRMRNALIGAAVGVAVGIAIDQTLGTRLRNESGDGGRALNYSVPIALFAGIGALQPGWQTVYRIK